MSWPTGLGPCSPRVVLARCMVATSCPRVVNPNCKHRALALHLSLGPPRSLSVHLPRSCHERSSSRAEHRHCSLLPTPATLMQPLASPCPPLSRARAPSSLTHLSLCLASLSLALCRARSPWPSKAPSRHCYSAVPNHRRHSRVHYRLRLIVIHLTHMLAGPSIARAPPPPCRTAVSRRRTWPNHLGPSRAKPRAPVDASGDGDASTPLQRRQRALFRPQPRAPATSPL
jgi:hypothetical protein